MKLKNPFPTQEEIAKITATPMPKVDEKMVELSGQPVEEWTLTGPFPKLISALPRTPSDAFERYLDDAASSANNMAHTESMHCVAREVGLFYLEKSEFAAQRLERFIMNRCGTTASRLLVTRVFTFEDTEADMDRMLESSKDDFDDVLQQARQTNPATQIGGWIGGTDSKQAIILVVGLTLLDLEPVPMTPEKRGEVVLKGRYLQDGHSISGAITKGEYGARSCVTDARVEFPKFVITCEVRPADPIARFVLGTASSQRSFFASEVFTQELTPTDRPPATFMQSEAQAVVTETPLPEQSSFSELPAHLLALVNAVRKEAGMDPMRLHQAQTTLSMSLAPHLYDAFQNDDDRANTIVYGILAGWSIEETLVDAGFVDERTATLNPRELLRKMLDGPAGRRHLLDPASTLMAVGGVTLEDGRTRVIVSTYAPLPEETHSRRVFHVRQRINKTRKLNGLKKIKWYKPFEDAAAKIAAKIEAGDLNPKAGAERFSQVVVDGLQSDVQIYTVVTSDLEDFDVFQEMVAKRNAKAAIMVAPVRPEGYPWTIYYIVVVMPGSAGSSQMASR
ncbi:MAG: hypothetical protein AAGI01_06255 [Myxococcota bacterium]